MQASRERQALADNETAVQKTPADLDFQICQKCEFWKFPCWLWVAQVLHLRGPPGSPENVWQLSKVHFVYEVCQDQPDSDELVSGVLGN